MGIWSNGFKSSPFLPTIPEARNADQEAEMAELLGPPVQVAVSVNLVDPGGQKMLFHLPSQIQFH